MVATTEWLIKDGEEACSCLEEQVELDYWWQIYGVTYILCSSFGVHSEGEGTHRRKWHEQARIRRSQCHIVRQFSPVSSCCWQQKCATILALWFFQRQHRGASWSKTMRSLALPFANRLKEQARVTYPDWLDLLQHVRHGSCRAHHIKLLRSLIINITNPSCPLIDFTTPPWNEAVLLLSVSISMQCNGTHVSKGNTALGMHSILWYILRLSSNAVGAIRSGDRKTKEASWKAWREGCATKQSREWWYQKTR